MKKILKALFLLVGAVAVFSACTDDPDYTWAEKEAGQKLWFSNTAQTAYELDENQSSVSFWLYRNNTDEALTVDIDAACTTKGGGNLFTIPAQAVFAAGEDKARVRVLFKFSEIEAEKKYEFEAAVKDAAHVSDYGVDKLSFSLVFNPDWDTVGSGVLTIGAYSLFGLPTTVTVPIQHKPGTNFYRLPRFFAYYCEAHAEEIGAEDEEIADAYKESDHLVFQLNDENLNDGKADWNFYKQSEQVQDEGSFLYGALISDYVVGHAHAFCTDNYLKGYKSYCNFSSNSTVDHNYAIGTIFVYQGSPHSPQTLAFNWTNNTLVPAEEWIIETDYNADFNYEDVKDATFTSTGFPAIAATAVKIQQATDVEGLFYIPEAFGVAGKGLAFYADADGEITIPADQPTGIMQQGMEVMAGQGSEKSLIKADGTYELNVEYYMIEEKVKEADLPATDGDTPTAGGNKVEPAQDPDDSAYEWPSGTVGVGERYEIVPEEPAPAPTPVPEPEPIIETRRISLGSFVEKFVTTPASLDDFCGTYELNAANFGQTYLDKYLPNYPDVAATVGPLEVTVAKGEKENEVVITGLFSGAANGDFVFDGEGYKGKDKVTGVWNSVGNYILIYPQTLKDKITFPSTATGKPDRAFELMFSPLDCDSGAASQQPLAIYPTAGGLEIGAASQESETVMGYAFYSSYDGFGEPINYDMPANIVLTKK
ncbi:MAG: hypothetical protein NC250_09620 [Alistipes senegalensis]|nr:hypothetical protein [Bacteroides cellulosilyticus]MCM1352971.1 hypothetical protein [Alistipes senegalensis]